jgi:hypothetical protein
MKFKKRVDSPLHKKAHRGFRGYPVATVAYYGPDDSRASKVAVGLVVAEGADAHTLKRLFSDTRDLRDDREAESTILQVAREHDAKTIVISDRIIGCPHEEAIDYPDGEACPQCPFWADRDRWTGEPIDPFAKARALAESALAAARKENQP